MNADTMTDLQLIQVLILAALVQENGVDEETYNSQYTVCERLNLLPWFQSLKIEATDGRFYLPVD